MSKKPAKQPYVTKAVKPAVVAPVAVAPAAPVVAVPVEVVAAAPTQVVTAPVAAAAAVELPKSVVEAQKTVQETATKSLADTRVAFEKVQASASEIGGAVDTSVNVFTKGLAELNAKVLGAVRTNSEAAFELFKASVAAKSPSDLITLQVEHARKQFEAFGLQAKDFSAAATKIATDATQPLKAKVEKILAL